MSPGARRSRGFTLIEVLVALAIVTVGMAALLSALSSSADSASYQRDKTFAEWVALNRLEEVRLAQQRPSKGKSDGDVELAGRKWKWSQEVLETEVKGIMRVDVSVRELDVPGASEKSWLTTVSGITGDALALPRGDLDPFAATPAGGPGGTGGPGGGGAEQPGTPRTGKPGGAVQPAPSPPPNNGTPTNPTD